MASATMVPTPPQPQPSDHLTLESIPTVDLRLLTQSELTALSFCSSHTVDLRRVDDVIIPKIDRSVFNESAGSRKQTFSRLRLAPRNNPNPNPNFNLPVVPELPVIDEERIENSRIVTIFKSLFNLDRGSAFDDIDVDVHVSLRDRSDELALVPVSVTYGDTVPVPVNYNHNEGVIDGNGKRKRGRKPKTETTMTSSVGLGGAQENDDVDVDVEVEVEVEDDVEAKEAREKVLVNKNGAVVNLRELGKVDDVFAEEIKRMTEGKETADELLRFVTELEGVWGSSRKKRKIIDANLFGDALPVGWKVLIAIKKKQGRAWVFCRRYLSPNGQQFVSCKEVSSYLLSLTGPQELEEQPTVQDPNISMDANVAEKNVDEIETKVGCSVLPDSSQSDDRESIQKDLYTSPYQEKEVKVTKDVHSGDLHTISASALKCHKCSAPFNEKNELLNHLLSCHKRKRRKSGAPVEEDVLVKDGKYECQFCDKIFLDRSSYFGHIGQHVKNYAKSIGATPGLSAKQKTSQPLSINDVSITIPKTIESAELNAEALSVDKVPMTVSKTIEAPELNADAPKLSASSELNSNTMENIITASPDLERNLENGSSDQNSLFLQKELIVDGGQNVEDLAEELFGKDDITTNYDTMEVDEAEDFSNVIPDDCFGSDNVLSNDNNDLCENSQEINATDYLSSAVSKSTAVAVENAEASLFSDSKQLVDSNDSFVAVGAMESGGVLPSEFDLPADIKENSSSPMPAYSSLVNKELGHDYFEDVMVGDDGGMTDLSGSGDIEVAMDGDDVEDSRNLEELSVVPHRGEESCGVTISKIDHMVSNASDFNLERGTENSLSAGQQSEIEMQNRRQVGLVEVTPNTDRMSLERHSDSDVLCVPKNYASSYFGNESMRGSEDGMVQATGSRGFHVEQTCRPENSRVEVLNNKGEERMNLFFTSESSDAHLNSNSMTTNDQSHNDVSNVLGAFGTFVEDKQPQVAKSLLSCLSMNEHGREVASNVEGNVSSTATTMHFSGLNKMDNSRSKSILNFNNMTDMNERFLGSVQHDTTPENSSPFQLWGQQSCGLEDNQNRVYGGTQLESVSNNNSLNLIDIQRRSGGQNNLNVLRTNEQRYSQHNETGVFNRSHQARLGDISHGNTLNLAGFSQQCDSQYNLNKPCVNQQNYSVQHNNQGGGYSSHDHARQERVAYGNSLSLASVQPCDTRYSLNKACAQQPVDTGYSMNKGYIDSMQGFSKLDNLGHSQDRDLMVGFGNGGGRPNQTATTDFLWRSTDGNILPGDLVDSSTSRGQSSGSFQAFDFLSDKGENDLYTANDKFDNMSNFDGLRSSVEPMEFSFMTTQDSSTQLEHSKDLQYNAEMDQSFGSLPNMMAGHVVSTLCVWCGNEFQQDPLACEMQAGSIGYLCPGCKARMSGQFL